MNKGSKKKGLCLGAIPGAAPFGIMKKRRKMTYIFQLMKATMASKLTGV